MCVCVCVCGDRAAIAGGRSEAVPALEEASAGQGISMVLADLAKQVADIKERVTFNTQLLQQLGIQQKRSLDKDKMKLPCHLPLGTYEAVLAVEQKLKSKDFYSQLVCFYCLP